MSLKKWWVGLISMTAVIGFAYGCSSTDNGNGGGGDNGDGGTGSDTGSPRDTGTGKDGNQQPPGDTGTGEDAAQPVVCAPSTATFTPPAYKAAAKKLGSCTQAQLDQFGVACLGNAATAATCTPYLQNAANKTCVQCILTPETASAWGPVVLGKIALSLNVPGCFELTGDTQCAHDSQPHELCVEAACDENCPVPQNDDGMAFGKWQDCTKAADQAGCADYLNKFNTCADKYVDGGAGHVCLPATDTTPTEQWFSAFAPLFCGGTATDAGGGG